MFGWLCCVRTVAIRKLIFTEHGFHAASVLENINVYIILFRGFRMNTQIQLSVTCEIPDLRSAALTIEMWARKNSQSPGDVLEMLTIGRNAFVAAGRLPAETECPTAYFAAPIPAVPQSELEALLDILDESRGQTVLLQRLERLATEAATFRDLLATPLACL
jgi:hypothetical protein